MSVSGLGSGSSGDLGLGSLGRIVPVLVIFLGVYLLFVLVWLAARASSWSCLARGLGVGLSLLGFGLDCGDRQEWDESHLWPAYVGLTSHYLSCCLSSLERAKECDGRVRGQRVCWFYIEAHGGYSQRLALKSATR